MQDTEFYMSLDKTTLLETKCVLYYSCIVTYFSVIAAFFKGDNNASQSQGFRVMDNSV